MIKLGRTVLDTDSIIKTSVKPAAEEEYLLEKLLKIEGSYYIHAHITREVKWPCQCIELLDRLIEINMINVLEDRDLIKLLKENYIMPYRTFLSNLKICCGIFNVDYYEKYYSKLEELDFKRLKEEDFLEKLKLIEDNILEECKDERKPSNLGELKTSLMSAVLYIIGNDKINVFVSEDKRARRCMVLQYTKEYHQLKALSITGIFYVLKDILNIEKAKAYINELPQANFKIYDSKNNTVKISGIDVINSIYNGDAVLVKDGMIKLK